MARRIRSRVSVDGDAMPGFVVAEGFGAGAGDGAEAEAPRDGALRFFLSLMIVAIVVDANDTINDSEFTSLMPCWIVRVMIERIVLLMVMMLWPQRVPQELLESMTSFRSLSALPASIYLQHPQLKVARNEMKNLERHAGVN